MKILIVSRLMASANQDVNKTRQQSAIWPIRGCTRIWCTAGAWNGGIKPLSAGSPDFNSPSGPSRLASLADFFGSLLAGYVFGVFVFVTTDYNHLVSVKRCQRWLTNNILFFLRRFVVISGCLCGTRRCGQFAHSV